MIQSPCLKICVMNPAAGICSGCGRTLNEIARWGSMSDADRARVMAELPLRMKNKLVIPSEGRA